MSLVPPSVNLALSRSQGPLQSGPAPQDPLREAAQGFEAMMLHELLKGARAGSLGGDMLASQGVDTAQALFDAEIAKVASRRSDLGIAAAVYRQFAGPGAD